MSVRSREEDVSQEATPEDDLDLRARKRVEVGLSPRRPTAKAVPARPPDTQRLPLPPAALALLLVTVLVVTAVLMAANISGVLPAWLPSWGGTRTIEGPLPATNADAVTYSLRLADDFGSATSPLRQGSQVDEWRTELIPTESVYRMEVWPNHLAWSLLGISDLDGYRFQTSALVDSATPNGYTGVIVRYQPDGRFYLFGVDGSGRYIIQQQMGEETTVIQPWTLAPFLTAAGSANVLTVEDSGSTLRFYGNNILVHEIQEPELPVGFVGLAGGAQGQDVADLEFDWFQLFDAVVADGSP